MKTNRVRSMKFNAIQPGMIPFWLFNDASSVAEKIQYLRACRKGGIRALAMHCRSGNLIPYASNEWYSAIQALVAEGRRLDMKLWLYDEDPYPSGAAGGQVMARRADLKAAQLVLREPSSGLAAGQLWEVSEQPVVWAGLVPVDHPLAARDLTAQVGTVRRDWFVTPWDSRNYYPATPTFPCVRGDAIRQVYVLRVPSIPKGYRLVAIVRELCGVDGSWGSLPDCLHPDTFPTFRTLSLDPYKKWVGHEFGKTIPGIFTDEEKPHGFWPVTPGLFEAFRQDYGFDLTPRLYQLFGEPLSNQYVETRLALREWIAKRFIEVFMMPYRKWCETCGIRLVGHMSPEDDPVAEAGCLGSVMPLMKILHCPGTDLIAPFVGNRETPTVNLGSLRAGSLRAQTLAPAAVAETFALFGWDTTTAKCHQIIAWHKVLGIDRFFLHGFFNSVEGVVAHEAPPDYGPNTPIFEGISELNRWTVEMEGILDGAKDSGGIAVLNSLASYWDLAPGMDTSSHEAMRHALWQTLLSCLRTQVGIHMADEADVAEATVLSGWLRVGACRYHTLLVPAMTRIPRRTFERITKAARAGVKVVWFGSGPSHIVEAGGQLRSRPALPGKVEKAPYPSETWCQAQLLPSLRITGTDSGDCYVRRFRRKQGAGEWLLAVNVSDAELALSLVGEGKLAWVPERVDGEVRHDGAIAIWRLSANGVGLFKLASCDGRAEGAKEDAADTAATTEGARSTCSNRRLAGRVQSKMPMMDGVESIQGQVLTGDKCRFKRLEVNRVRLDRPQIRCKGINPVTLDFPKPYWQLSENYRTEKVISQYVGKVPVISTVTDLELRYRFAFDVKGVIPVPLLVCDPRCARGAFKIEVNGRQLGGTRHFPLETTKPLRIRLTELKQGKNSIELCFSVRSAMEGLLAQLYLEGEFNVDRIGEKARLSPAVSRDSRQGWQKAGLPHYMGSGAYEWTHEFTAQEVASDWGIEFEGIVDSADLYLNGRNLGRRAWAPWKWTLKGIRSGQNTFELRVHGTGGNFHKLTCPAQPQGWIGRAWLESISSGERKSISRESAKGE